MYGNAESTLAYLEKCNPINQAWRDYIRKRGQEVQLWISDLRAFADIGTHAGVSTAVNLKADALQMRLDRVVKNAA